MGFIYGMKFKFSRKRAKTDFLTSWLSDQSASLVTLGEFVVASTRQDDNTKERKSQASCSDMDDDGA